LVDKAVAQRGPARGGIVRMTFPLVASVAERLECIAGEQKLRLGAERRALQSGRINNVSDFDYAHRRADFHQRRDAEGAIFTIDNGISVGVIQRGSLIDPSRKFRSIGERPVLRHIRPDRVVVFDPVPQRGHVPGAKLFDAAVAAVERYRSGARRGPIVDRRADRLPGLRMDVVTHGLIRRARSSRKNLLSSAFVIMTAKPSNVPSLAISVAVLMKACVATRASEPPTLMRRTPMSARSLTVRPNAPLLRKLIGFGATALTVASICSRVLMPGEYRQSAPASAKALIRRMVSSRSGRFLMKPSVRAVNTTSPPALSIAARAALTRASATSNSYSGLASSPVASSIDRPATPVAMQRVTFSAMRPMSSA